VTVNFENDAIKVQSYSGGVKAKAALPPLNKVERKLVNSLPSVIAPYQAAITAAQGFSGLQSFLYSPFP